MNHFASGLRLPVALLLAGDTAKVLAALAGHEPPETSAKSDDPFTCGFSELFV